MNQELLKLKFRIKQLEKERKNDFRGTSRPCVLENLHSGRILSCNSIVEFTKLAGLKTHSRYHITPIFKGLRTSYKGWYDPNFLNQKVKLKDKYNNEYKELSVRDVVRKKILSAPAINKLISKKSKIAHGLALSDTKFSDVGPRNWNFKQIKLTNGKKTITSDNISGLAKQLKLKNSTNLYNTVYGFTKTNGFFVKSIQLNKKRLLNNVELR